MYNKVFLLGNLTKDPEMRYTASGLPITRFTIAVNRGYGDNRQTDFLRVSAWRKLAEFCGEYLTKGKAIAVEGSLQINEYEKDGTSRTSSEIIADRVEIISKKDSKNDEEYPKNDNDSEIPF
jgi:single-strand DNA-binding protein